MKTEYHIKLKDFCSSYSIDELFVIELYENELIELKVLNKQRYIIHDDLPKLEKMIRMNQELGINIEGIEAIHHLLQKIENLQNYINKLHNKMAPFEDL